jgi:hypothetical protein
MSKITMNLFKKHITFDLKTTPVLASYKPCYTGKREVAVVVASWRRRWVSSLPGWRVLSTAFRQEKGGGSQPVEYIDIDYSSRLVKECFHKYCPDLVLF